MKKRYLLIISILVAILFAGLGVNYLLSLRKVSFILENNTESITVYNSDKKSIKEFSSNGHMLVQKGDYYLIPSGDNLSSDAINFSVSKEDKTVVVNPSFTDEYLDKKLQEEMGVIESAIASKYPSVYDDYTLAQGKLYKQGNWFGGLLKPKVSDIRDERDPYRVVLQKKDDGWHVIRRPEYVLTSSRYEEVPTDVLRAINSIVGEPGN